MADYKNHTALLIIDNQQGFIHPTHWGPERSNPSYEKNVQELLAAFRTAKPAPLIVHIQHSSLLADSPLHPSKVGYAFYSWSTPLAQEPTIVKSVNSGFIGTNLESLLREHGIRRLYIAGLTTDHCVSTTTRMAGNLHVTWYVDENQEQHAGEVVLVGDATACWKKPGGKWDAELIHAVHLESLEEFASVRTTEQVLREIRGTEL